MSERGFTLIELLVVIAIIGTLAFLGMQSWFVYKGEAAYAVARQTVKDAQLSIEARLIKAGSGPGAVPLTAQNQAGPISDPLARDLLFAFQLPQDLKLQVMYDPACDHGGCQSEFVQANHCFGAEYIQWVRFGDGVETTLERLGGVGCP